MEISLELSGRLQPYFVLLLVVFSGWLQAEPRKLVVITDMEPDDRIALHLLASSFSADELLMVGTTVMHAARKKALARRLLDQLGLQTVKVFQGTGGSAQDYREFSATRPARTYPREGQGILSAEELARLEGVARSSSELESELERTLSENDGIEMVLLAPPIDLMKVLKRKPELRKKIKRIHIMGGWAVSKKDPRVLRSTYNWNMDPKGILSSNELMRLHDVPMTLYSYHTIKDVFPSRSINPDSSDRIDKALAEAMKKLPSLQEGARASGSWDRHILESLKKVPDTHPLKAALLKYAGNQFAPADALVIAGLLRPDMIKKTRRVAIRLDESDIDPEAGVRVYAPTPGGARNPQKRSNIELVEAFDGDIFQEVVASMIERLPEVVAARLEKQKAGVSSSHISCRSLGLL